MPDQLAETTFFRRYAEARREFLQAIGCDSSCRDPLSEFAERVVCQHLGGSLALSRVNKGFDLVKSEDRRVQVKYLANPSRSWRNEHGIRFDEGVDEYAIVFFEALELRAFLVFPRETLGEVCRLLGKKHADQDRTLQLTRVNFDRIVSEPEGFEKLGVKVVIAPASVR